MKTTKKLLQTNRVPLTIRVMRAKFFQALFGIAVIMAINAAGFLSTARADEGSLQPVQTLLDSTTLGPGNIIVDSSPVDPIIPSPDFGNNSFAQSFSPDISAVPEPTSISLAIIGAGVLVLSSKLRRRRSS